MTTSKATSAHTLMSVEVDFSSVDRSRSAAAAGSRLTYLPFVLRAVVDAIVAYPNVNAEIGDDELIVHPDIHLGIAVDLDNEGLVVPVLRNAQDLRVRALARESAGLAARARGRRLAPDDFAGGTFTVTNPGPFGTFLTGAIINQPQVAILATDGVRARPVALPDGQGGHGVAVRPIGNLALTFDHRAIDGAYAARFLRAVRAGLERDTWDIEL